MAITKVIFYSNEMQIYYQRTMLQLLGLSNCKADEFDPAESKNTLVLVCSDEGAETAQTQFPETFVYNVGSGQTDVPALRNAIRDYNRKHT